MTRLNPTRKKTHRHSQRLRIEPLEDRMLLATCNVTRLGDFGAGAVMGDFARGDLRFCINHANNNPGPDAINLNVTGTIFATQLPQLGSDITITGPGADLLAVDAWAPIFHVLSGATVSISGLTITDAFGEGYAGGIHNLGNVTLKDSTVSNHWNTDGDGLGGGIQNLGNMTISGSTISGNRVDSGNLNDKGAGIYNFPGGVLRIFNSTISGNHLLSGTGGGIYNAGSLVIRFSTITQNSASSGGGLFAGALTMDNTIVAGNTSSGPGDDNLEGAYTGSSNLIGGDPMLGPLADNGGPTLTHALLPGSPAIDAGDNSNAPTWDQRGPGFPRIVNGTVDVGAYEVQAMAAPSALDSLAVLVTADLADEDSRRALSWLSPVDQSEGIPELLDTLVMGAIAGY
jgi:hypothetical protein